MKELCSKYSPRASIRRQKSARFQVITPSFSQLRYRRAASSGIFPCIKLSAKSGADSPCISQTYLKRLATQPLETFSSEGRLRLIVCRILGTFFVRRRESGPAGWKEYMLLGHSRTKVRRFR